MKQIFVFNLLFIFSFSLLAQPPQGYYDGTEGLTGEQLKTALYNIIKNHDEYPYSSSGTDVWDILKDTDEDPDNPQNVILFYTGWSVNAAQEYNNGNGWNREHVWAKSHGDFGTSPGPGTDAHHLRPTDISVNGARDSRWFANCNEPYYDGGEFTGCYYSLTEWTWQPRDEVKGDVARMIFYMATRYEGDYGEPDLQVIDYFPTNNHTQEPVHALLTALLQWHEEDPVDAFEQNRNDVIYSYQDNRNPFIDHPEFVAEIWGDPSTGINTVESADFQVYPNPATASVQLNWSGHSAAKVVVFDVLGNEIARFGQVQAGAQLDVSQWEPQVYFIRIEVDNTLISKQLIKL